MHAPRYPSLIAGALCVCVCKVYDRHRRCDGSHSRVRAPSDVSPLWWRNPPTMAFTSRRLRPVYANSARWARQTARWPIRSWRLRDSLCAVVCALSGKRSTQRARLVTNAHVRARAASSTCQYCAANGQRWQRLAEKRTPWA